jgi:hypothetical protein
MAGCNYRAKLVYRDRSFELDFSITVNYVRTNSAGVSDGEKKVLTPTVPHGVAMGEIGYLINVFPKRRGGQQPYQNGAMLTKIQYIHTRFSICFSVPIS